MNKMGMDTYTGRGVVFTVDEFLKKVINSKNKKAIVDVCHSYHKRLVKESVQTPNDKWRAILADSFTNLSNLKPSMKLTEIREIVACSIMVEMVVYAKYNDCYVVNSEYVEGLFDKILEVSGHGLPYISEVTAWGSGISKGVACVVFNSDSCFERCLSDKGKALEKLFGRCNETEWTEVI